MSKRNNNRKPRRPDPLGQAATDDDQSTQQPEPAQTPPPAEPAADETQEFSVSGADGNDGEYQAAGPPPGPPAGLQNLLTMDTLRSAARAIAGFRPQSLPLKDREVLVGKMPAERFEELLPQLLQDFGPYVGLSPEGEERPVQPAGVLDWVHLILKYYPELSGWLIQTCCTEPDGQALSTDTIDNLDFDEKLLLLGAVLLVNFVNNGAVRVFFGAGLGAAHSALKEGAASRQ